MLNVFFGVLLRMRVKFLNRKRTISAAKHEDIVTWMRLNDFERYKDNQNFMQAYSDRKKLFEGKIISPDDVDAFVNDLQAHKIIEVSNSGLFVAFRKHT